MFQEIHPFPHSEEERLSELYSYEILDTEPDPDFNELVTLAAQLCQCPTASITFVDRDRQWFKARIGVELTEGPRETSFCTYTIQQDEPFIVEDATLDPRFADNPDVTGGLNIRFYAGVPIFSASGKRLGSVCVCDREAREPSDIQLSALRLISKQVTTLLHLRLRNKMLQEYSREVLLRSESSFESFFNQSRVVKWIYEMETLRVLQVNEAAIDLYGYSREEFLQMAVYDLRTAEEKKNVHQLFQKVYKEDWSASFTTVHQAKDGRLIPVEVTVTDVVYLGKAARMASVTDITERVRLEGELHREKDMVSQKVMHAASTARIQERDHIGKELHDNINQILASTKLYLEMAEGHEDLRVDLIRRSRENIDKAIKEIRHLAHELVVSGEAFNLEAAARELLESYSLAGGMEIELSFSDDAENLPEDLKLNLFRVIQEQVCNITKYAEASQARIFLYITDRVVLQIEDNGKGFDTLKIKKGIGLSNIKKRVEFYKGNMHILSSPGKGTRLILEVPMEERS